MTTGEKLARALRHDKLSQHELARLSGISQANISRYTKGLAEPRTETLDRIAAALGRKREDLRGDGVVEEGRKGISLRMSQAVLRLLDSPDWVLRMDKDRKWHFILNAERGTPLHDYVEKAARARRYYETEGLDDDMYEDLIVVLTQRFDGSERRQKSGV